MASGPTYKTWQVPPAVASESSLIGWIDDACGEGLNWLKSQRCSRDYRKALDTLSGMDTQPNPSASYRSRLNTNRLKRNIREVVSVLSRLRPFWGYQSDNKAYQEEAAMMNQVCRSWYLETFADRAVKEALQYAAATGRGWLHPIYRRDMAGTGKGDIKLLTFGAPCVLPTQLPSNGDWQSAYAVTILDEWPIYMAHGMFPQYQDRLVPSSSRFWYQNDNVKKSAMGNWWQRAFKSAANRSGEPGLPELLIPIRKSYVLDLSLNTTKEPIPMGEPGSSWFYEVPFIGQDIPAGHDMHGNQIFRKANENDARLYPYRRLIISSDKCRLYDGPAFDWHGMFPGVSFCPDSWPWEPLGFSLVHDGYDINESIKEIDRGVMDKVRAQLNPALSFDMNVVSKKEMERFDPFKPNARMAFDGMGTSAPPAQPVLPYEFLKVSPEIVTYRQVLQDGMDSQMCINDVAALAKARTVGSVDQIEKIMEMQGPIITDMSRSMEPPMRDLGNMIKYNVLQYYTTTRVMQLVGADMMPLTTFDFEPDSIVPSHLPDEDSSHESQHDRIKRARTFADNLRFFILPNSLHEYQQMEMKLGLVQLIKAGAKISTQTLAEAWNVRDYGKFDGVNEIERWKSEKEMELEFMVRGEVIKQNLETAMMAASVVQPPGSAQPGKQPEGRPTTGMDAPRLVSKDGGARSTITQVK